MAVEFDSIKTSAAAATDASAPAVELTQLILPNRTDWLCIGAKRTTTNVYERRWGGDKLNQAQANVVSERLICVALGTIGNPFLLYYYFFVSSSWGKTVSREL